MYKGAILDLDNVLFPTSWYEAEVLHSTLHSMINAGLPTEFSEGLERLIRIRKKNGSNAENHFDKLCESYGLVPPPQRVVQAGVSAYHSEREGLLVPQQEANDFLDFLVENNFRNCLVTSGVEQKQWFKLIRLGLVKYFLLKDEEGKEKKELVYILKDGNNDKVQGKQELVAKAIADAVIDPERSFIVDDRPYGIVAAKKAGIRYGFKLKRGKYQNEPYPQGVEDNFKHDMEAATLQEIARVLRGINLAK